MFCSTNKSQLWLFLRCPLFCCKFKVGKNVIDATIGETTKINELFGTPDKTTLELGVAMRGDGATLREFHVLLKAKDPGFGGLVRIMNKRQEFLWVHPQFEQKY